MTEMIGLLVIPDVMMYKSKALNKCHYNICPHWNHSYFNNRIMDLKINTDSISPIFLKKDLDFSVFIKRLVEEGLFND